MRVDPLAPLSCADLANRGLTNESYCCPSCHEAPSHSLDGGGMRAVIVLTPAGEDVEAEICCSQAHTLSAHHAISNQLGEV